MALKDFRYHQTSDTDLNKVQDNLGTFLNQLDRRLLSGLILEKAELKSAHTVNVPHMLGRAYQGWIILDQDGSAIIWRDAGSIADKTRFLPLKSSADVNVKIWVF